MSSRTKIRIAIFLLLSTASCKKWIEVPPPDMELSPEEVFSSDAAAVSAMLDIYIDMEGSDTYISSYSTGLLSDELTVYDQSFNPDEFYRNALRPDNRALESIWNSGFNRIYKANLIIEQVGRSSRLSAAARAQLTGEAEFVRAFWNVYLTHLFGPIPVIRTTDRAINAAKKREGRDKIMELAIADLQHAESLMSEDYLDAGNQKTIERVRPNRYAAKALLARFYLYSGAWAAAETESSTLIGEATRYALSELDKVFLKNSSEAIWQLMPINPDYNTAEGYQYIALFRPESGLSPLFVNDFETHDKRRLYWIDSLISSNKIYYYPFKYKIKTTGPQNGFQEYSMVLRLAEQYLIRAEARQHLNNLQGAVEDLNILRRRADLDPLAATDESTMAKAIERERRAELFTEWGHRWFDLNRTHRASEILGGIKADWQATDSILPVPRIEIQNNPNLTQNNGY